MTHSPNNKKAGAASTAAGPLDTEFVHPVSVDNLNEGPSPEESSTEDALSLLDPTVGDQMATDHTASASSLDDCKEDRKLLLEQPVPSTALVPKASTAIADGMQNPDWKQLVQKGGFGQIRWDDFADHAVIQWQNVQVPLVDTEVTRLMNNCEIMWGKNINRTAFEHHLKLVAKDHRFDSAQEWLMNLPPWDQTKRVEWFLTDYLGSGSSPYHMAVSRYWLTAMVARMLEPGHKVDMVPVIVGRPGTFKTSAFECITPLLDHCGEACLTDPQSKLFQKVIGKILVVWEELAGIKGKVDAERVQTFITSRYTETTNPNGSGMIRRLRRFLLVGTSNRKDFLRNPAGDRRMLPFETQGVNLEKLKNDIIQIWAEALFIVKERQALGLTLVDYVDAERLAQHEYDKYRRQARWYDNEALLKWLDDGHDRFTTEDALRQVNADWRITLLDRNEMCESLRQLGFDYRQTRVPGLKIKPKRWRHPNPSPLRKAPPPPRASGIVKPKSWPLSP